MASVPKGGDNKDQKSGDFSIRQHEDLTVTAGEEIFTVTINVNDEDAAIEIERLPKGLVSVADSRKISGIPTTPGEYAITVKDFNQFESTETRSFTIPWKRKRRKMNNSNIKPHATPGA